MKVGKFYQSKKYAWTLYPSYDLAFGAPTLSTRHNAELDLITELRYWSMRLACSKLTIIHTKSMFMALEVHETKWADHMVKVLTTEGEVGWIRAGKWELLDIEEVNQ